MQHISLPEMNKQHWLVLQRPGIKSRFAREHFKEFIYEKTSCTEELNKCLKHDASCINTNLPQLKVHTIFLISCDNIKITLNEMIT